MAIVKKVTKKNDNYTMKGKLTYCEAQYNDYTYEGKKFVRIQTFGSESRKDKGKQSQVIHINKETAEQLIQLFKESFDLQ